MALRKLWPNYILHESFTAVRSLLIVKHPANPLLDLHLGNVGLAIPQLADQDPDDVMNSAHMSLPLFYLTLLPTKHPHCPLTS